MGIVILLLAATGLCWLLITGTRRPQRPQPARGTRPVPDELKILDLEAEHWLCRTSGDVARADQIEAVLRDMPWSGWLRNKASGLSGDR